MGLRRRRELDKQNLPEKTERIIADLIDAHKYLHEARAHRVVYVLDLYSYLTRGERVTDTPFYPYQYGPFSFELEAIFEQFKERGWKTNLDYLYGKVVPKYESYQSPAERPFHKSPSNYTEEINTVTSATSDWSNKELRDWSKETRAYNSVGFSEEIDFSRLDLHLEEAREEFFSYFPTLSD